jgi:hypothetical protein
LKHETYVEDADAQAVEKRINFTKYHVSVNLNITGYRVRYGNFVTFFYALLTRQTINV